jgi:protein phosphatase
VRTAWGSATDGGPFRRRNEDALLAHPPVFLVADGMGGHDSGDLASRIAVEEAAALTGQTEVTADDLHLVVRAIEARLHEEAPEGSAAGTTLAGVALARRESTDHWLVFNIGDSRVYRLAAGVLTQVSVDHSLVQELVDHGTLTREDAARHPERHVITRAIGTGLPANADYWLLPVRMGDRMLVCTDGLTDALDDAAIALVLGSCEDPQIAAELLVDGAIEAGSRDNVTVVVVDAAARPEELDTTFEREHQHHSPTPWDEQSDGSTNPRASRARVPEVP